MAIKYKMRYTGQEIEELLDHVKGKHFIQHVDILPEASEADLEALYECGGKLYFSDGVIWARVSPSRLEYHSHYEFPILGNEECLYIATDEQIAYYWSEDHYVPIKGYVPDIDIITCGGAE